ncbi:MAG: addiction module protein [Methylococcales symbiont of Hymedesmia sp. n. MRB-2018]|nr:MAG: addiction module protein [Methylococcales symbiont of Hymedesmia sp. n. MRB-2018]
MFYLEISNMSVIERLQTMEALWDSLTREPTGIKSPKWHEEILFDRKEKIESGHANFISLEELKSKHGK